MPIKNYYKILQVDPSAEQEVIEAAYRRLARKYHPDTNRSPDANSRMQDLNEAYEILKESSKRISYNIKLGFQNNTDGSDSVYRHRYTEDNQKQENETEKYRSEVLNRHKIEFVICPKCQEENPVNIYHCVKCGQSIRAKGHQHEKPVQGDEEHGTRVNSELVLCNICNEYNSTRNRYCIKCGAKL